MTDIINLYCQKKLEGAPKLEENHNGLAIISGQKCKVNDTLGHENAHRNIKRVASTGTEIDSTDIDGEDESPVS